jgi:hypothetical protein
VAYTWDGGLRVGDSVPVHDRGDQAILPNMTPVDVNPINNFLLVFLFLSRRNRGMNLRARNGEAKSGSGPRLTLRFIPHQLRINPNRTAPLGIRGRGDFSLVPRLCPQPSHRTGTFWQRHMESPGGTAESSPAIHRRD